MRIQKQWLLPGLVVLTSALVGCQKTAEVSVLKTNTAAGTPQKLDATTNKKRIDMQTFQINQSQLPPAEKQRLIQQIQAAPR